MTSVLEKQQSEPKHSITEPDITTHSPEMEPVRQHGTVNKVAIKISHFDYWCFSNSLIDLIDYLKSSSYSQPSSSIGITQAPLSCPYAVFITNTCHVLHRILLMNRLRYFFTKASLAVAVPPLFWLWRGISANQRRKIRKKNLPIQFFEWKQAFLSSSEVS